MALFQIGVAADVTICCRRPCGPHCGPPCCGPPRCGSPRCDPCCGPPRSGPPRYGPLVVILLSMVLIVEVKTGC